jgi:isocitrate dehydrogenase (NAD+)
VPQRVILLAGDGIGPEVTAAARRVIDATGVELEWEPHEVGVRAHERTGEALPQAVVAAIREAGVALKGPVATPVGGPFRSVNLALREALGLHSGVRPARSADGRLDVVVVRMNVEDLYAGIEAPAGSDAARLAAAPFGIELGDDAAVALKPLSRAACARTAREAFARARTRVTAVHKATVMPHTDGLFVEAFRAAAADWPGVEADDRLVDSVAAELVTRPERFDVLLAPMLYGDVLSDLAAALGGGLPLAPGANVGEGCVVFEAVHGTVAHRAGRDTANPGALILCGAMLLRHLGEDEAAARVERAVAAAVEAGAATLGTSGMTEAVITRLAA